VRGQGDLLLARQRGVAAGEDQLEPLVRDLANIVEAIGYRQQLGRQGLDRLGRGATVSADAVDRFAPHRGGK
jgi:hypothetical protein